MVATNTIKTPFKLKLLASVNGLAKVLRRPAYLSLAFVMAFVMLGLVVYISNFGLLWFFLTGYEAVWYEKLFLILGPYQNVIRYLDDPLAASILAISVLGGVNLALLLYVRRHAQAVAAKQGLAGLVAGAIGAGCGVCGTSIVAPLLASVGATASASLTGTIGVVANIVGICLLLYSVYRFGLASSSIA